MEITQDEQTKEKIFKYEDSLQDLCDNIKCTNIQNIGISEEKREKGAKNLFE